MSLNVAYVNTVIYKGAPMFAAYILTKVFPQQCCCLMISDFFDWNWTTRNCDFLAMFSLPNA